MQHYQYTYLRAQIEVSRMRMEQIKRFVKKHN